MSICRLCLREKELCKKSHIIPNFMYRELFDEKHRMIKGTPVTGERPQSLQSGEYQGGLLCPDCDNGILGSYEAYASKVLYSGGIPVTTRDIRKADDGLEITIVQGLDYRKFKLFLLSLLWRASISTLPFFAAVDLGPYEKKLRIMLLTGDPGPSGTYPCVLTNYKRTRIPGQVVHAPLKGRLDDGKIIYAFIISGMMYTFRVVEDEQTDWILEATIHEDGEMQMIHMPKESAARLFNKLLGQNIF